MNILNKILLIVLVCLSVNLNGQITVNTPFKINSFNLIDEDRQRVDDFADLADMEFPTEGQLTFIENLDYFVYYDGSTWIRLISSQASTDSTTIYAPSHNLADSITNNGYVPIQAGTYTLANASASDSTHFAYAISAPTSDSLTIVYTGKYTFNSHGKTIGSLYYLQDDGSEDTTPGTVTSSTVFVENDSVLYFTEIGANSQEIINPRVLIPSAAITLYSDGNSAFPSDVAIQQVIDSLYVPLGVAKPNTIFYTANNTQSAIDELADDLISPV